MKILSKAGKNLEDAYLKGKNDLANKLLGIQFNCKHEQTSKNSDVYESYTSCDLYGKDLG